MSAGAIVIMAKAPGAGLAKTRLIPALGAAGAAALAGRMLAHAAQAAACAAPDRLEVCAAPDAAHPAFTRLARDHHGLQLTMQGDGDLGQRMHRAFARVLALHGRAVMIGTDAPALDAKCLRRALDELAQQDAVFVPALDGGYALIGLRRPQACLFEGMAWSTADVMSNTRERLRDAGLRWTELPPVADVDEPADLVHLPAGWLP